MSETTPPPVITIDGPAGVGKSTISRKVAARLGFTYLDTGAMYRAAALFIDRLGIDSEDETALQHALATVSIELLPAPDEFSDVEVVLNGEKVGALIRSPAMSMRASQLSALPAVRSRLTALQQEWGKRGALVAEGRDTGTVVFPRASYKFYLDASPEIRARRRALQLHAKGEEVDEKKLLEMTIARDRQDMERPIAPLVRATDALLIDTSDKTIDDVLLVILRVVESGLQPG
ncbi:(d)CMP kinase [Desulfofustis limnaeus]|jgi:cytidylate kinase|uniref:Cytidylate kinase n=1 Tax=Desulfofustis limnaeus TaxID=2740163 RepID=A0ABM7WDN5_9BACT|nr:(d)CMP kinase [Desulfofustis limnaeus]MDX9896206.1 (d)CMP kinase [Desulfofustis sp.]BDD89076.1 cytidylate kinase [Desulfofustis limnaeus]